LSIPINKSPFCEVATAAASTDSPSKKSVRSRRNRRNGGTGGTKKPLLTSGEEVRGSSEVSAVVKEGFEDLEGACALAPRGTSAKGGVSYDQRVPNINLSNLEDFLEAVEASTDEEKEAVEDDEPNIEGAGLAMFDSLAKVQAETPKKGRSRHVVDNLLIYYSFIRNNYLFEFSQKF
jgi:hypothetical protein